MFLKPKTFSFINLNFQNIQYIVADRDLNLGTVSKTISTLCYPVQATTQVRDRTLNLSLIHFPRFFDDFEIMVLKKRKNEGLSFTSQQASKFSQLANQAGYSICFTALTYRYSLSDRISFSRNACILQYNVQCYLCVRQTCLLKILPYILGSPLKSNSRIF